MPAKMKYGFLCDGAMRVHGKFTYQGVFDRIQSPQFPAGAQEACLCFKFTGPVGPHILRIQLVDSQGSLIAKEQRRPIECREFVDNEIVITFKPLILPKPGFYAFRIFLDDEVAPIGEIDIQGFQMVPPEKADVGDA